MDSISQCRLLAVAIVFVFVANALGQMEFTRINRGVFVNGFQFGESEINQTVGSFTESLSESGSGQDYGYNCSEEASASQDSFISAGQIMGTSEYSVATSCTAAIVTASSGMSVEFSLDEEAEFELAGMSSSGVVSLRNVGTNTILIEMFQGVPEEFSGVLPSGEYQLFAEVQDFACGGNCSGSQTFDFQITTVPETSSFGLLILGAILFPRLRSVLNPPRNES